MRKLEHSKIAYCELHCKTNYSFLTGASHADELVDRAIELGYSALAITDENTLAGVVRAYTAVRDAKKRSEEEALDSAAQYPVPSTQRDSISSNQNPAISDGSKYSALHPTPSPLKLIIGAEIILNDAPPVVLWATDRASYAKLTRLLTVGRRRAPKGECWLCFEDVAEHHEGLLAGVIPNIPGNRNRTLHIA